MKAKSIFFILLALFSTLQCYPVAAQPPENEDGTTQLSPSQSTFTELPLYPLYRDYFSQLSSYGYSFLRFRNRGYSSNYESERFEGLSIKDFWRDTPYWSIYSGSSNYSVETNSFRGLNYDPLSVGFGSLGGSTEAYIKHSHQRLVRGTYSFSNRTYTNRATAIFHSGVLKNGWSIASELTYRGGRSLSIDGVWADGWVAMLSVQKQFSPTNTLQLTLLTIPSQRANAMAITDEAAQLTSNNLYNPNWGYQSGKQRAARISSAMMPTAVMSHSWELSDYSRLYTSAFVSAGKAGYTSLNWQTAPNPNPDYYRYMPSFETSQTAAQGLAAMWHNDPNVSQINFNNLYSYNTLSGSAHYIQENRIRETVITGAQTTYNASLGHTSISSTTELYYTHENRYKVLDDLFGAKYWVDVDYFVSQDEDFRYMTQNNMAEPNRHITTGEKFGYYYSLDNLYASLSLAAQHRLEYWNFNLAASIGWQILTRNGHWEKQLYPAEQSLGQSPTYSSLEYALKAGVEYHLGRKLSVGLNVLSQSKAPSAQNVFIDANYRNALVSNLKNESITSIELNFNYITSLLRASATVYHTTINNQTDVINFYDDRFSRFTNTTLQNINSRYMGIEIGVEVALYHDLWLKAGGAFSDNRYTDNPQSTSIYQTSGAILGTEILNYKDLRCSPTAQTISSLCLEYQPYGWVISLTANGFANGYELLSPIRYSPQVIQNAIDPIALTTQQKLPSSITLDIFGGRTFYLANGSRIGIYAGINNLTNNRGIKTSGFQTNRLFSKRGQYTAHPSKYYHALGINGFLNFSFTL